MQLILRDLFLTLDEMGECQSALKRKIKCRMGGRALADLPSFRIIQRALDTRSKPPRFVFQVSLQLEKKSAEKLINQNRASLAQQFKRYRWTLPVRRSYPRPVIIGAGPAGLFAALSLAEVGMPVTIVERGDSVDDRSTALSRFYMTKLIDRDSNMCYGEGGAGAYSDGKLYSRIKDQRIEKVFDTLVCLGADPDIKVNYRPHLGSDVLPSLIKRFRQHLQRLGVHFVFRAELKHIKVNRGIIKHVQLTDLRHLDTDCVILCTGHSAREVWVDLNQLGVSLETRPYAIGFRVEHPQALINQTQYGEYRSKTCLPPAEYRLAFKHDNGKTRRGVYTFCMCPGGMVVPTPTVPSELCLNGMSTASRKGQFANSALLVTVTPKDYAASGYEGIFGGVDFQRAIEQKAYKLGGGKFNAPALRLTDYLESCVSQDLPATSYPLTCVPSVLEELYPPEINAALREALRVFSKRMPGFLTNQAVLMGVETRSSSPLRIKRDETRQAVGLPNLFPAGEGCGYSGGIVSSAVDGIKTAEAVLEKWGAVKEELTSEVDA